VPSEISFNYSMPSASLTAFPEYFRSERFWAFPLHDACWHMLAERLSVKANTWPKLAICVFDILLSTLSDRWDFLRPGHDYGGATRYQSVVGNPVRKTKASGDGYIYADPGKVTPLPTSEEVERASLDGVLEFERAYQPDVSSVNSNCFSSLPNELIYDVLSHLPSSDLLALRLASRDIARITKFVNLPQSFWASRFLSEFEMGFARIAVDGIVEKPDWRTLYTAFRRALQDSSQEYDSIKNRKRIWKCLSSLANTVQCLLIADDAQRSDYGGFATELLNSTSCDPSLKLSTHVTGEIYPSNYPALLQLGCRERKMGYLPLPQERLDQYVLRVSYSPFWSRTFVSGLKLSRVAGARIEVQDTVGLQSCQISSSMSLPPGDDFGLIVATSAMGVVNLSVLRHDSRKQLSQWMEEVIEREPQAAFGLLTPDKGYTARGLAIGLDVRGGTLIKKTGLIANALIRGAKSPQLPWYKPSRRVRKLTKPYVGCRVSRILFDIGFGHRQFHSMLSRFHLLAALQKVKSSMLLCMLICLRHHSTFHCALQFKESSRSWAAKVVAMFSEGSN
jgi:hypothetical protein